MDYDKGPVHGHPSAQSQQDCCDLCAVDGTCAGGVYYEGTCYFKTAEELKMPTQSHGQSLSIVSYFWFAMIVRSLVGNSTQRHNNGDFLI